MINSNYNHQGYIEPVECPACFSSMINESFGRYEVLKCQNSECAHIIELNGENDE